MKVCQVEASLVFHSASQEKNYSETQVLESKEFSYMTYSQVKDLET